VIAENEVARLTQQIALEFQAAQMGISGLAQGTVTYEFIATKLERMIAHHEKVKRLVGEPEAIKLLAETLESA